MKNRQWLIIFTAALLCAGCADNSEIVSDFCPNNPDKQNPGVCGCDILDVDANDNGIIDCLENMDFCPTDANKTEPGICGCEVADVDENNNGVIDCLETTDVPVDECPDNELKTTPGICGCDLPDTDTDGDTVPDCFDLCKTEPDKVYPGFCGCDNEDLDENGNGIADCLEEAEDLCPDDPNKTVPGICGCGAADTDSDGDKIPDCLDQCASNPDKVIPGVCGCDAADTDSDGDKVPDCIDECKSDPQKVSKGVCGCNVSDIDSDGDGIYDCIDECASDPLKSAPGICGCNIVDDVTDSDGDGTIDCLDGCPNNPAKIEGGPLGCDVDDSDSDGIADKEDDCPYNPKITTLKEGDICNIITDTDGKQVFAIWTASDFKVLRDFMTARAEMNNFIGMDCVPNKYESSCSSDKKSVVTCENIAGSELGFIKKSECLSCEIDDHKILICEETAEPEIEAPCGECPSALCINNKCESCLTGTGIKEDDAYACCDPESFAVQETEEYTLACADEGYIVKKFKIGGNPGDNCETSYQPKEIENGITLKCQYGIITRFASSGGKEGDSCDESYEGAAPKDGKTLQCISQKLKSAVLKGGKDGDLCAVRDYQDECLSDGSVRTCQAANTNITDQKNDIYGHVTTAPCAFGCQLEDASALHASCVKGAKLPENKQIVRMMRDINLSESIIPTTTPDLGCLGNWEGSILYQADFDGQGHTLSFSDKINKCAVNTAIFDIIVDSDVHDLILDLNVSGMTSGILSTLINHANVHDISWQGSTTVTSPSFSESNPPIFGVISGFALDSQISDINIFGNIFIMHEDYELSSSMIGAAQNSTIKNAKIDIGHFIGNNILSGVLLNYSDTTISNIDLHIGEVASDLSSKANGYSGLGYYAPNAYHVHLTQDKIHAATIFGLSQSVSDDRTELIDITSEIKDADSELIVSAFGAFTNSILKKSQISVDHHNSSLYFISSFQDISNAILSDTTFEFGEISANPENTDIFGLSDQITNSDISKISLKFGDITNICRIIGFANDINDTRIADSTLSAGNISNIITLRGFAEHSHDSDYQNIIFQLKDVIFNAKDTPDYPDYCGLVEDSHDSSYQNITMSTDSVQNTYYLDTGFYDSYSDTITDVSVLLPKADSTYFDFVCENNSSFKNIAHYANVILFPDDDSNSGTAGFMVETGAAFTLTNAVSSTRISYLDEEKPVFSTLEIPYMISNVSENAKLLNAYWYERSECEGSCKGSLNDETDALMTPFKIEDVDDVVKTLNETVKKENADSTVLRREWTKLEIQEDSAKVTIPWLAPAK